MKGKGVSVEVINLLSICPLDRDTIVNSLEKTGLCVTIETGWPQCGIGSEISEILMETDAFNYLDAPMERITGSDVLLFLSLKMLLLRLNVQHSERLLHN